MKKEYTTPEVEKVEFNYREQVVASPKCDIVFTHTGNHITNTCSGWVEQKPNL